MDSPSSQGRGAGRALVRLLVTLVVLALIGAVVLLLGQLNARTYTLQRKGDELVIMKGRQMPYGVAAFQPDDPVLAETYAPIPLHGREAGLQFMGARFDDRDSLDKALFRVLDELARNRLESDDPKQLERAVYYVRRAAKLRGLTDEQRGQLQKMEAQVSFFQAKQKLDEARRLATDSVELLRIAARSQSRDAREALALLAEVEPLARGLERTMGRATQLLNSPVGVDDAVNESLTAKVPPPPSADGGVEGAPWEAQPPGTRLGPTARPAIEPENAAPGSDPARTP